MKSIFLSLLTCATVPLLTLAQPFLNNTRAFCEGRDHGLYCNPADALHIVECPSGKRSECPRNKFCADVGRVPDCYDCEAAFDPIVFCEKRGAGTFCAGKESGSNGVWSCPSGKELACPQGSRCKQMTHHDAICEAVHDDHHHHRRHHHQHDYPKMEKAVDRRRYRTHTHSTYCACTSLTFEPTQTITNLDSDIIFVSMSVGTCAGRSTVTSSNLFISTVTSFTLVLSFTETVSNTFTQTFRSVSTSYTTDVSTSYVTSGQTPDFVCFTLETYTNAEDAADIRTVCLSGALDLDCAASTTNNIGQTFCQSYILPNEA